MTKFYTCVSDSLVLKKLNQDGSGLSWRDRYLAKMFGGKIFTKEMFLTALKEEMDSRGNGLKTQTTTPSLVWNWWAKRGAIIELK